MENVTPCQLVKLPNISKSLYFSETSVSTYQSTLLNVLRRRVPKKWFCFQCSAKSRVCCLSATVNRYRNRQPVGIYKTRQAASSAKEKKWYCDLTQQCGLNWERNNRLGSGCWTDGKTDCVHDKQSLNNHTAVHDWREVQDGSKWIQNRIQLSPEKPANCYYSRGRRTAAARLWQPRLSCNRTCYNTTVY